MKDSQSRPAVKSLLLIFLFALPFLLHASSPKFRTFTNSDGKEILARVVDVADFSVTVERSDGQTFTTDIASFSAEDQAYIEGWGDARDQLSRREVFESRGYVAVPFAVVANNMLIVQVEINGEAFRFLLDTGASRTTLDTLVAQKLGLESRQGGVSNGLGTSNRIAEIATVDKIKIGGIEESSRSIWIIELAHVNVGMQQLGLTPIDGLLGGDVFYPLGGIVDYESKLLYLRKPDAGNRILGDPLNRRAKGFRR